MSHDTCPPSLSSATPLSSDLELTPDGWVDVAGRHMQEQAGVGWGGGRLRAFRGGAEAHPWRPRCCQRCCSPRSTRRRHSAGAPCPSSLRPPTSAAPSTARRWTCCRSSRSSSPRRPTTTRRLASRRTSSRGWRRSCASGTRRSSSCSTTTRTWTWTTTASTRSAQRQRRRGGCGTPPASPSSRPSTAAWAPSRRSPTRRTSWAGCTSGTTRCLLCARLGSR